MLIEMAAAWLAGPLLTNNAFTASLPQASVPILDGATAVLNLGLSIGLALVAGLYPAYRAARLSPMEAMRHV